VIVSGVVIVTGLNQDFDHIKRRLAGTCGMQACATTSIESIGFFWV
jgi:hypothetical protein